MDCVRCTCPGVCPKYLSLFFYQVYLFGCVLGVSFLMHVRYTLYPEYSQGVTFCCFRCTCPAVPEQILKKCARTGAFRCICPDVCQEYSY